MASHGHVAHRAKPFERFRRGTVTFGRAVIVADAAARRGRQLLQVLLGPVVCRAGQ